ncbi:MAG: maf protein [Friedmanniella sp.]|nr:maf protein [Friedmanniella sp.]
MDLDRGPAAVRLVLASASPARLLTLRNAGLDPEVIVSGVDESTTTADTVADLTAALARLKADAVLATLDPAASGPLVLLGCDSMLELDGQPYGKPADPAAAVARWRLMRNRSGILHTGHHLAARHGSTWRTRTAVASTVVHFADVSDAEIEAYVATGEPLAVAGAFTVDGLGGAFVTGVEGDHHNVVGVSLPLLRRLLAELDVSWPTLWRRG